MLTQNPFYLRLRKSLSAPYSHVWVRSLIQSFLAICPGLMPIRFWNGLISSPIVIPPSGIFSRISQGSIPPEDGGGEAPVFCVRATIFHKSTAASDYLPAGAGLPARDADGVPFALPTSLIFFRAAALSDISPAVASPSLVDPTPILVRRAATPCGIGVPERLPGAVAVVFLIFFREDSLPLDSDSAGEPALFKDLFFLSPCLLFP